MLPGQRQPHRCRRRRQGAPSWDSARADRSHGKLFFRDLAGSRRQKGDLKGKITRQLAFEAGLLGVSVWLYQLWTQRGGGQVQQD